VPLKKSIRLGEMKMGKALIIGAGGVASVAVHKCVQNSEVFEEICIASRTKSKCDELKAKLDGGKTKITTAQVCGATTAVQSFTAGFKKKLYKIRVMYLDTIYCVSL